MTHVRFKTSTVAAFVIAAATVLSVSPTQAQEAFTRGKVSASVIAGFGAATQGDSDRNPYASTLGASAGYSLGFGLYLGAMADYFVGDSEYVFGSGAQVTKLTYDWSHMAAEVGFDLPAAKLVVRPSLAVGAAIYGACFGDACESDTFLLLSPAVVVHAPLGEHSFFSFTLRYMHVPESDDMDPRDGAMFGLGLGAVL